jgi:hypothetical protein
VRTYTVPRLEILNLAEEAGLKLLMGVWWDDPRYLEPNDSRQADSLDWRVRGTMELGLAGTCIFSWTDD